MRDALSRAIALSRALQRAAQCVNRHMRASKAEAGWGAVDAPQASDTLILVEVPLHGTPDAAMQHMHEFAVALRSADSDAGLRSAVLITLGSTRVGAVAHLLTDADSVRLADMTSAIEAELSRIFGSPGASGDN